MNRSTPQYSTLPTTIVILLFSALYMIRAGLLDIYVGWLTVPSMGVPEETMVVDLLIYFQQGHPILSAILASLIILIGAIVTMRLSIRYNLLGSTTHIPFILYLAISVAMTDSHNLLTAPIASLFLAIGLHNIFNGYMSRDLLPHLFSGCFWVGLLPILYPSTIPLYAIFFMIVVLLDGVGRDILTAIVALFLPSAIYLYIQWFLGIEIMGELEGIFDRGVAEWFSFIAPLPKSIYVLFTLVVALYALTQVELISITHTARNSIKFCVGVICLGSIALLLPSASVYQFGAFAAPLSIAFAAALFVLPKRLSLILYILFIAGSLLAHVLP